MTTLLGAWRDQGTAKRRRSLKAETKYRSVVDHPTYHPRSSIVRMNQLVVYMTIFLTVIRTFT